MTDDKKPGVAYWAGVVIGFAVVLVATILATVVMVFGLMHYDAHTLSWMAELRRMRSSAKNS
jgi:hypothetical protein